LLGKKQPPNEIHGFSPNLKREVQGEAKKEA
jgi:hypothetical protein